MNQKIWKIQIKMINRNRFFNTMKMICINKQRWIISTIKKNPSLKKKKLEILVLSIIAILCDENLFFFCEFF